MVDLQERFVAMLEAEVGDEYRTVDYLCPIYQRDLRLAYAASAAAAAACASSSMSSPPKTSHDPCHGSERIYDTAAGAADDFFESLSSTSSSSSHGLLAESWREKICEWTYQVVDHFDFSREVAAVSIHYLDRYLARVPVSKKMFQLAAMTCMYLAIKLYEPATVNIETMLRLSRGYFTVSQMETMELSILKTLNWRIHPPTTLCFCKHTMYVLPSWCVSMEARYEIAELARFLLELAVIDYYFVIHRPSHVALAAIMNAIEEVCGRSSALPALAGLATELSKFGGGSLLDPHKEEVLQCRSRLQILYEHGGYADTNKGMAVLSPTSSDVVGGDDRTETVSPVCVSYGLKNIQQAQRARMSSVALASAPSVGTTSHGKMGVDGASSEIQMKVTDTADDNVSRHCIGGIAAMT